MPIIFIILNTVRRLMESAPMDRNFGKFMEH